MRVLCFSPRGVLLEVTDGSVISSSERVSFAFGVLSGLLRLLRFVVDFPALSLVGVSALADFSFLFFLFVILFFHYAN